MAPSARLFRVARGSRGERGGELNGPRGKLLRAVVDLVHAGGQLVVDVRLDLDGTCGQRAGAFLEPVRARGEFAGDSGADLLGTFRKLARARVGLSCAGGELACAVLQLLGAGCGLPGSVVELR